VDVDVSWLHYSPRPRIGVESYSKVDARFALHPARNLELAVVGQDLLGTHQEYWSGGDFVEWSPVRRSAYLKARWSF
jgi:hypothetical protein